MTQIFEIRFLSGSLEGRQQRLVLSEGQSLRLGRNTDADIKFSDELDDSVSGVHAEIRFEKGRLFLVDQRSTNGTYLNNAPCPPLQKIAVPDGARIRLGQQGPEMQLTLEAAPPVPTEEAGATAAAAKEAVGRDTLQQEIARAREEERAVVDQRVSVSGRSLRTWLVVAAAVLLVVIGIVAYMLVRFGSDRIDAVSETVAEQSQHNLWPEVEQRVASAVAHVRCRYMLRVPQTDGVNAWVGTMAGGGAVGSAVLIRPDVLLTARHVVEPWTSAFDVPWSEIAERTGAMPEYQLLEIQFPGQQPISATVLAVAENRDLALLSVADRTVAPVPVASSNEAVMVADQVAILGYPHSLGRSVLFKPDYSGLGNGEPVPVSNMEPTFLLGTVTRPVRETGERAGLFSLDASVEPGSSGGPVVNRDGELVGVISQRLERTEETTIQGMKVMLRREVGGSVQAVNPEDIQQFLARAGLL